MPRREETQTQTNQKKAKRKRRSKWAADLEHLIPGAEHMTDEQLETALLWMLNR